MVSIKLNYKMPATAYILYRYDVRLPDIVPGFVGNLNESWGHGWTKSMAYNKLMHTLKCNWISRAWKCICLHQLYESNLWNFLGNWSSFAWKPGGARGEETSSPPHGFERKRSRRGCWWVHRRQEMAAADSVRWRRLLAPGGEEGRGGRVRRGAAGAGARPESEKAAAYWREWGGIEIRKL